MRTAFLSSIPIRRSHRSGRGTRHALALALPLAILAAFAGASRAESLRPKRSSAPTTVASADEQDDDDDDDDEEPAPSATPRTTKPSASAETAPSSKKKPIKRPTSPRSVGRAGATDTAKRKRPAAASASASATDATPPAASAGTSPTPKPARVHRDDLHAGVEIDFVSRFVWRGVPLTQGAVLQPSAVIGLLGFDLSVFGNILLNEEAGAQRVSALVPALTWTHDFGPLRVEPGVFFYGSPGEASTTTPAAPAKTPAARDIPTTWEIGLDLSLALGAIRLLSTNRVDVSAHAGTYYGTFGPEYERSGGRYTLKLGADFGYASSGFAKTFFGVDTASFELVEARAAMQFDVSELLYLLVHAEGGVLLWPSLRDATTEPGFVVGGFAAGIEL